MQYGLINSNASFIGLPVLSEIYGALGGLLTSMVVIPQRVTMWTAGVKLFDDKARTKSGSSSRPSCSTPASYQCTWASC